ncbi:aldehyde dehydrogenase family protein [Mycolicibacterium aubagnense]
MGGWKAPGIERALRGADGMRKFYHQETVVEPRTSAGAGGNYYHNSMKALARMNTVLTKVSLIQ